MTLATAWKSKIAAVTLAAATVGSVVAVPMTAEAAPGRHFAGPGAFRGGAHFAGPRFAGPRFGGGYGGYRGYNRGFGAGPVIAGAIGALALGAIATNGYGYGNYYAPAPVYDPYACPVRTVRVWNGYQYVLRNVSAC